MRDGKGRRPIQHRRGAIRPRWRRESGQSLVELGLLVPILVLLLIGVLDFGRILMTQHVITNAAREGARISILGDQTTAQVQEKVKWYLQQAGLKVSDATITVSGLSAPVGQPTTVTINYPVESIILRLIHYSSSRINMSSTSSMLHE